MPEPVSLTASSTYGPGCTSGWSLSVLLVEVDVGGRDGQLAALGHGVAGVDRQVHDDLLDLAGVGLDQPEVAARDRDQTRCPRR